MAGNLLLVGLFIALLLAVGALVFGVTRIARGILKYHLEDQPTPTAFRHPKLGLLKGEHGLWTGIARPNGRKVPFRVTGPESAPNQGLIDQVSVILARFDEVEREATDFLRAQENQLAAASFAVYGLDVLEEPDRFVLEFVANGDDSRIWRVEFESGAPTAAGFDD